MYTSVHSAYYLPWHRCCFILYNNLLEHFVHHLLYVELHLSSLQCGSDNIFDIYVTEYGTALTTILPILFLYLNTVIVTAGTFEP